MTASDLIKVLNEHAHELSANVPVMIEINFLEGRAMIPLSAVGLGRAPADAAVSIGSVTKDTDYLVLSSILPTPSGVDELFKKIAATPPHILKSILEEIEGGLKQDAEEWRNN
tara:strand:- start:344 stop:682 length:339 start_codon:yes stop_codon:yes gene_type:complete